ncbi:MAG: PaaI family thioesterase [Gammaproteobacteria bacterium]|nr:PaaI family thioesterase [Gammaproteobacteria bacterium]MCP5200372.1 PaaI family thioesterase [Gammaproteobacteria bacterium]
MTASAFLDYLRTFIAEPGNQSPHNRFLGLELVNIERGRAVVRVPYDARLAGNTGTGVLHGGVITTALDSACGMSVIAALGKRMQIATLDLRIDYLRPAVPGEAITAAAHCYKVTRNVCFVRAIAYHDDRDDPIANAAASFMITADKAETPRAERNA